MKISILLRLAFIVGLVSPPPPLLNLCIDAGFGGITPSAHAQTAGMIVDWDHHDSPGFRSSGVDYIWNGTSFDPVVSAGLPVASPADEGGDWYYDITEVKDGDGNPIGSVAVGYVGWSNWGYTNGTCLSIPNGADNRPTFLTREGRHRGGIRQGVAYYNTAGQLQWFRAYHAGILHSVIQDSQGALVVAGWAFGTVSNAFADMANAPPLFYNPTAASTVALSCGEATASERKMMLMKLDLEGEIDWNHFYSNNDDPVSALTELSYGWSVVETDRNGVKGYRIVGTQRELVRYSPLTGHFSGGC